MDAIRNFDGLYEREGVLYNNILSVEVTTDVVTEPLSTDDAKAHLRIDFDDEDDYIEQLIKETREQIEDELNLALAPKTLKVRLRNEQGYATLPYGPVTTITDVKDVDGVVVSSSNYTLKNGVLETSFDTDVFVTYVTGYTTTPNKYLRLIKERLAWNYANRGDKEKKNNNKVWLI